MDIMFDQIIIYKDKVLGINYDNLGVGEDPERVPETTDLTDVAISEVLNIE